MQPNETVQLFFNGNTDKPLNSNENKDNVYKNYIIKQNTNLLNENKKVLIEMQKMEQKYEEMEDEVTETEKRLNNTKNYLKNFRFISKNNSRIIDEYNKFHKDMHIDHIINTYRLMIVCFSVVMMVFYVAFLSWTLFFSLMILHSFFIYVMDEVVFIPQLKKILHREKLVVDLEKQIKKENKSMEKTMDIISEFIDNAL